MAFRARAPARPERRRAARTRGRVPSREGSCELLDSSEAELFGNCRLALRPASRTRSGSSGSASAGRASLAVARCQASSVRRLCSLTSCKRSRLDILVRRLNERDQPVRRQICVKCRQESLKHRIRRVRPARTSAPVTSIRVHEPVTISWSPAVTSSRASSCRRRLVCEVRSNEKRGIDIDDQKRSRPSRINSSAIGPRPRVDSSARLRRRSLTGGASIVTSIPSAAAFARRRARRFASDRHLWQRRGSQWRAAFMLRPSRAARATRR